MNKVLPSILNCDFWNMKEVLSLLDENNINEIHVDVMDGNFVEDIAFGPKFVNMIKEKTSLKVDLHLMIINPERKIDLFLNAGADNITFNVESTFNVMNAIHKIKEYGKKAGIAISPHTSVESIFPILPFVDQVLVLTIKPGTHNSFIIKEMFQKIEKLKEIRESNNYSYKIMVDGKVDNTNIKDIIESGADKVVSGGYIFKNDKIIENILELEGMSKNHEYK